MRKRKRVKCKNCQKVKTCPKVVHYSKGKKRVCGSYIAVVKKPSNIPIRRWIWNLKEVMRKKKEEEVQRRLLEEQAKLQANVAESAPKVETQAPKKIGFWGRVKRFFLFWLY